MNDHWDYVWWCYAIGGVTFAALIARAVIDLRRWKARAEKEERP
jgi:heme exporter protein CcmD